MLDIITRRWNDMMKSNRICSTPKNQQQAPETENLNPQLKQYIKSMIKFAACLHKKKNLAYQSLHLSGETHYKVCFGLVECSEHIQISSKIHLFFCSLISS